MTIFEYYGVLGCHAQSSDEEIKACFKKLSMQHHPDRPSGDVIRFLELGQAYQNLEGGRRLTHQMALKMTGEICLTCDGSGVKRKSRGFTSIDVTPCVFCKGCGYVPRNKVGNDGHN